MRLLLLIFCLIPISSPAQDCEALYKSGMHNLCKGDTAGFFADIHEYQSGGSCEANLASSWFIEAIVFREHEQLERASAMLDQAMAHLKKPEFLGSEFFECHDDLLESIGETMNEVPIVHEQVSIYLKLNRIREAILYLDLYREIPVAKNNVGCINGLIKQESSIALDYARCYAAQGDTLEAVKYLLTYVVFNENDLAYQFVPFLHTLLINKELKKDVVDEMKTGIQNAREEERYRVALSFYGRKVPYMFMTLDEFQKFISYNQNIQALMRE